MSKYIILRLNHKPNPYSGCEGKPFYELFYHTNTKYESNRPYFSAAITEIRKHSIEKENLPAMLKLAQNYKPTFSKRRYSKEGKIFILKTNSPKLKEIINLYK